MSTNAIQTKYAKQSSFEKLQFEEGSIRNCPNRLSSPFTSKTDTLEVLRMNFRS